MSLDPLQKKKLKKIVDLADKGQVAIVEHIDELENKLNDGLSSIQSSLDTQIGQISEELKKKLEQELVLEIDREELTGDKGEQGVDGKDGIDGKDGKDGVGINGKDGTNGIDGLDGADGKDGSSDTGVEIVDKINALPLDDATLKIDKSHIGGLDKMIEQDTLDRAIGILDNRTSFLINKVSNLAAQGTGGSTTNSVDVDDLTKLMYALNGS